MGGRGAAFESKGYSSGLKTVENKIYKNMVEHASLLDNRGNVIFEKSDNSTNAVQFTIEQLKKMDGMNLTHNHPSNSTFSAEDISVLTNWKLKSIRAVGKERAYQLTRAKGAQIRSDFAKDFHQAQKANKKITDREYRRYDKQYKNGTITLTEFNKKIPELNKRLNQLNSDWLKKNAKKYGYRYSVIERR